MTYKKADPVRAALATQGLERLMLETDCPYLAPEPHRGQGNEPAYLKYIAERAAEVLGVAPDALAAITNANTRNFFGLE